MKITTTLFTITMLTFSLVMGQNKNTVNNTENSVKHKHSLGSSFFMLGNFLEDSPEYVLLTYGYRLTKKDRIFTEFNTWKYSEPLGTYGKSEELYPGYVKAYGIGFGYQRFHWKGAFTTVQATPFVKQYYTNDGHKIQKGFQLYLQFAVGYRFEFFNKRWYLEPAYALKYWPIDNNYPSDFLAIEQGTPKHIFEPSLNFGFKF